MVSCRRPLRCCRPVSRCPVTGRWSMVSVRPRATTAAMWSSGTTGPRPDRTPSLGDDEPGRAGDEAAHREDDTGSAEDEHGHRPHADTLAGDAVEATEDQEAGQRQPEQGQPRALPEAHLPVLVEPALPLRDPSCHGRMMPRPAPGRGAPRRVVTESVSAPVGRTSVERRRHQPARSTRDTTEPATNVVAGSRWRDRDGVPALMPGLSARGGG